MASDTVLLREELKRLTHRKIVRREPVSVTLTACNLNILSTGSVVRSLKCRTIDLRLVSAIRRGSAKQPEQSRTTWGISIRAGESVQQPCLESAKRVKMTSGDVAALVQRHRRRSNSRDEKEFWFDTKNEEAARNWYRAVVRAVERLLQLDTSVPLGRQAVCPCAVSVKRAQGLSAADVNGFSDPFVVAFAGKRASATRAIPKTLNPVWKEVLLFYVTPWQDIGFAVFDHDRFTNDLLGCAILDLSTCLDHLSQIDGRIVKSATVILPLGSSGGTGELMLSVRLYGVHAAISAAASAGSPESQFLVGYASVKGIFSFPKDLQKAVESYEASLRSVEAHFYAAPALTNLAVLLADRRPDRAALLLDRAAQQGLSAAKINQAVAAIHSDQRPTSAGMVALRSLADAGDVGAAELLGCLSIGGPHADRQRCLQYLTFAAEKRHARSAFLLSELYMHGHLTGTPDIGRAKRWLRAAADSGHAQASFNMALTYLQEAPNVDWHEALRYLRLSCANGNAKAGLLYFIQAFNAPPIHYNADMAVRCLRRSVDLAFPPALYLYGCLLTFGNVLVDSALRTCPAIESNPELGVFYLRRAEALGELAAKNALGLAFGHGVGVAQDLNAARRYFGQMIACGYEVEVASHNQLRLIDGSKPS